MPLNLIYNHVFFHSSLSVYIISNLCYFSSHLTMIRWSYILKVFIIIIIIINIFLLKLSLLDHVTARHYYFIIAFLQHNSKKN